jgi:large repetitive protein
VVNCASNCTPEANTECVNTLINAPLKIDVLSNDRAADGSPANLTNVTPPSVIAVSTNGTTTVNADGTVTYRPNTNFTGTDTFTYRICDKNFPSFCSTTTVKIIVACPTSICLPVSILRN